MVLSPFKDVNDAGLAGAADIMGQGQVNILGHLALAGLAAHLIPEFDDLPGA